MKTLGRLLFLCLFSGLVPIGCNPCGSSNPSRFEITEIQVVKTNPFDFSDSDTTHFYTVDSVGLRLSIAETKSVAVAKGPMPVFGNAAFACEPPPSFGIHKIASVEILSASSFAYQSATDSILPGDTLTGRFAVAPAGGMDFKSIDSFFPYEFGDRGYDYFLKLTNSPYQPVSFKVDVIVTLTDNHIFEIKGESLKIK